MWSELKITFRWYDIQANNTYPTNQACTREKKSNRKNTSFLFVLSFQLVYVENRERESKRIKISCSSSIFCMIVRRYFIPSFVWPIKVSRNFIDSFDAKLEKVFHVTTILNFFLLFPCCHFPSPFSFLYSSFLLHWQREEKNHPNLFSQTVSTPLKVRSERKLQNSLKRTHVREVFQPLWSFA